MSTSAETLPPKFKKRRVTRRRVLLLIAALLLAWPPLAWAAARWLVVDSRPERAAGPGVLGGSSTYEERTELAARLFNEGFAPVVLLTVDGRRGGWSQAEQRNPFFAE